MEKIMYLVFGTTNISFIKYFETIEEAKEYRDKRFPEEKIIKTIVIE